MVNHMTLHEPAEAGMVIRILRMRGRRLCRCKGLTRVSDRAGGGGDHHVCPRLELVLLAAILNSQEKPLTQRLSETQTGSNREHGAGMVEREETSVSLSPREEHSALQMQMFRWDRFSFGGL